MPPTSHHRPRRRRLSLAVASVALAATLAPTLGSSPAGAATAPLTTTDGIGIRVDENALNGPALEAIESALQPFVNQMIRDGASGPNAPFQGRKALHVSSNVELSLDFLTPGGSRLDGGLKVHADIEDIEIRFVMDPVWPFADCNIWARPDDGSIDAIGAIDRGELPDAPLTVEPIQATWDDDPSVTSDGVCWTYVVWQAITNWWNGIWDSNDPESTAARIERELNDVAQDLIDGLWTDHVVPVIQSLDEFGISFNQLRTDTHGLIVTADVDATNGITFPINVFPGLEGPYYVADTEDSGADSDVDALLATRSEVTVTVHPNVVNQFANALYQLMAGSFAVTPVPGAPLEEFLLAPANRGSFVDNGWRVVATLNEAFYTTPTGAGGRPQFQLPDATFRFYNSSFGRGVQPVATFTAAVDGIDLFTEVRAGMTSWGPAVGATGIGVNATLTQAIPAVASWAPNPSGLAPFVPETVNVFNDSFLVQFLSLAPINIGGVSIDLCTACSRVSGDERYTEFFTVG